MQVGLTFIMHILNCVLLSKVSHFMQTKAHLLLSAVTKLPAWDLRTPRFIVVAKATPAHFLRVVCFPLALPSMEPQETMFLKMRHIIVGRTTKPLRTLQKMADSKFISIFTLVAMATDLGRQRLKTLHCAMSHPRLKRGQVAFWGTIFYRFSKIE